MNGSAWMHQRDANNNGAINANNFYYGRKCNVIYIWEKRIDVCQCFHGQMGKLLSSKQIEGVN